jgi:hypothetical protein
VRQMTERIFELHWRQLNQQRWQAVLTDPETKLQYLLTSKLAFRTVLANLSAVPPARPSSQNAAEPAEDAEAVR